MKFLDLFAGIGGFRMGMEQAGHECVGSVEWDEYARKSYEAIYDTEGEWTAHDITEVTDEQIRGIGHVDCITGGFPCQSFSVAGKRGGFQDTRGTLFFEIARIAKQIKPRLLLLENVKGLLSHDKGKTAATIFKSLDELGYDAEWQVLNSKNFGVPQNRERVFIVGHLRGEPRREVFPIERENRESADSDGVKEFSFGEGIAACIDASYTKGTSVGNIGKGRRTHIKVREATKRGYGIAYPGDSVNYSLPNSKTRRGRVGEGVANTLDTGCQQGVVTEELRIRKLTPRECWRLQGFPDRAFDKAQEVNSNSQLYKQAGNSVTVNVVYEIARRLA